MFIIFWYDTGGGRIMTIGEKLYKIRTDLNLTQKQFAKKVGVSQAAITNWEHGRRQPRTEQLKKIAKELQIPVSELVNEHTIEHFTPQFLNEHPVIDHELAAVINQLDFDLEPVKDIDISKISTELRADLYNILLAKICYDDENDLQLEIYPSVPYKKRKDDKLEELSVLFYKLNDTGKAEALKRITELTQIKTYVD